MILPVKYSVTMIDNNKILLQMVWIETPTNPTMKLVDIQGVSNLLKDYPNIISVVDNTFMSSYFQVKF